MIEKSRIFRASFGSLCTIAVNRPIWVDPLFQYKRGIIHDYTHFWICNPETQNFSSIYGFLQLHVVHRSMSSRQYVPPALVTSQRTISLVYHSSRHMIEVEGIPCKGDVGMYMFLQLLLLALQVHYFITKIMYEQQKLCKVRVS